MKNGVKLNYVLSAFCKPGKYNDPSDEVIFLVKLVASTLILLNESPYSNGTERQATRKRVLLQYGSQNPAQQEDVALY